MRMCCLRPGLSLLPASGRRSDAVPPASMQESLSIGSTSRPCIHSNAVRLHTPVPQYCSKREPSRRAAAQICKERLLQCCALAQSSDCITAESEVEPEANTEGMSAWLDGLKWDAGGLVAVIAQVSRKPLLAYTFLRRRSSYVLLALTLTGVCWQCSMWTPEKSSCKLMLTEQP